LVLDNYAAEAVPSGLSSEDEGEVLGLGFEASGLRARWHLTRRGSPRHAGVFAKVCTEPSGSCPCLLPDYLFADMFRRRLFDFGERLNCFTIRGTGDFYSQIDFAI